jgi:hypothetical protein
VLQPLGPVLARWTAAGASIGNHGANHLSLNDTEVEAWLGDAARCHEALTAALGKAPAFFRYPFLQEGVSFDQRDAAAMGISKLDERVAQVTIDTSDWVLAAPYLAAVAHGDRAQADRIGAAYVAHLRLAAAHYRDEAQKQLGRQPKQVMLMHASALAADWLGRALDGLAADGFDFISLDDAADDPIYKETEQYVGKLGLSWIYRIAPDAGRRWKWDDQQATLLPKSFAPPPAPVAPPPVLPALKEIAATDKVAPTRGTLRLRVTDALHGLAIKGPEGQVLWSVQDPKLGEVHVFDLAAGDYALQERAADASAPSAPEITEEHPFAQRMGATLELTSWHKDQQRALDPRIRPGKLPKRAGSAAEVVSIFVRPDGFDVFWGGHSKRAIPIEQIENMLLGLPLEAWPHGRLVAVSNGGLATPNAHQRMDANELRLLPILDRLGIQAFPLPT